jgi:hypothetical protein
MATQVQYRRGTGTENNAFTGAVGEITVDTTAKTLRIHDGSTAGGSNIATSQFVTDSITSGSAIIANGTSNVAVLTSNGNVTSFVNGTLILTTSSTGLASSTGLTATGTVTGATLTDGTASLSSGSLTGLVNITGSGTATLGTLTDGTASITSGAITGATSGSFSTTLTATGNITGGNLITGAQVVATGNITSSGNIAGAFLLGNGSAITGLPAGYSNSDVQAFLPTYTGNLASMTGNIITTGNITGANYTGNVITPVQGGITGVGALDSGSITANFGAIDIGISNLTVGNIVCGAANALGNIGSSTTQFNTVHALATSAQYADVAEYYIADENYDVGTVLVFGGEHEVTTTTIQSDSRSAGVVSESPAFLMNSGEQSDTRVALALLGRVSCKVLGKINKGDRLVCSATPGVAIAYNIDTYTPGCIIGKALESYDDFEQIGLIEIVVGKV